ncbi:MAG: hypothetical protein HZA23_06035 [Nitrospirae bacterium]|nr:hypothetical protein [Nitrospirota bacterium]
MLNLTDLIATVRRNCRISDAGYWGDFGPCDFLLRVRELYRWEQGIPFFQPLPHKELGDWIRERETIWEQIQLQEFGSLSIERESFSPFDEEAINRRLLPLGYVYGGGLGARRKPLFFLGDLRSREERNGFVVLVSDREYARELSAPPAMLSGRTILVRMESVRRFLWERVELWQQQKGSPAMARALSAYPFDSRPYEALQQMAEREAEAAIAHEVGEGLANAALGPRWQQLLTALPRRGKAEIIARAAKDLLADCLSTLPFLFSQGAEASLHFYFSHLEGMRLQLFPDLREAYEQWCAHGDRSTFDRVVRDGQSRWLEATRAMLALFEEQGDQCAPAIEQRFLPLQSAGT